MMLQEYYTEEPIELLDCDYPGHTAESSDFWDIDDSSYEEDCKEGYHWYLCPIVEKIEKGRPVCDVDKLVHKIVTDRTGRHEAAYEADSCMDGILHKRLAIDLRMGEILKHLKKQGVSHLGYRSIGNFSVEHLSFSGRLAAGYYAILPGFRYISDDRFHELPEEMQDIIRTGTWYQSPSMVSSWPLEEDDEQEVMDRDPRLEEPWKYFEDVDEFLIYEAETAEMRERKRRHDSRAGQEPTGQGDASKCAGVAGSHTDSCRSGSSPLCAVSAACATELPSKHPQPGKTACSCGSCNPCHNEEALSGVREICTMPHDADPAETFLMDILEDDSGSLKGAGMSIRFFFPDELYELWNMMAMNWLIHTVAEEMTDGTKDCDTIEVGTDTFFKKKKSQSPEGFLVALLQDYLLTERIHLKVASNYAILKRDHFQCQVPGCKCRRNLQVYHELWGQTLFPSR